MSTLLKLEHRFIRLVTSVAFNALFKSLVTNYEEISSKVKSFSKRRKLKKNDEKELNKLKNKEKKLYELLECSLGFIIKDSYDDVSAMVREQIYDCLYTFFNKLDFSLQYSFNIEEMDIGKIVFFAINDRDKTSRNKALLLSEKFIHQRCLSQSQELNKNFDSDMFKVCIGAILRGDTAYQLCLIRILKIICKYNPDLINKENIERLKKMALFSQVLVGREIFSIIMKETRIKFLKIEEDSDSSKVRLPTAKEFGNNFENFCKFLNDKCLREFTSQEIGESFAKLMLAGKDSTLFNFKLYATALEKYQKKSSKSRKKSNPNLNLPEILMYCLRYS